MASKSAKKPKIEAAEPPKRVWLTRKQAAARLGLSYDGLRGRVRLGILKEHRDPRSGNALYDSIEIDEQAARKPARRSSSGGKRDESDPGEISARAFSHFAKGHDLRSAVIDLRVTAREAEEFAKDFARLGGEHLLSSNTVKELRSHKWLNLPDGEPFIDERLLAGLKARETRQADVWQAQAKSAQGERDAVAAEAKRMGEALVVAASRIEELERALGAERAARAEAEKRAREVTATPSPASSKATEPASPLPPPPASDREAPES